MFKPLEVKARSKYRIWIRYADGEQGEVDLSHLAGQGVFELWEDEQKWKNVRVAGGLEAGKKYGADRQD